MNNIIYPEEVSLSVDPLSPKEAAALGKRGLTKILEEKKKSCNFKYATLFSGRTGVKISGYQSLPASIFSDKQEHKYLLPFHEYCHIFYDYSGLDDPCSIFIDSEHGAVCLLINGLAEKYVAGDEVENLKKLLEVVGGMVQYASARNMNVKIYYDRHIESLSGELFSYESNIIKKSSRSQLIKNPYYSVLRSILGVKSQSLFENTKSVEPSVNNTLIYLMFTLLSINTVAIGAGLYMIYDLQKNSPIQKDIDYLRMAVSDTEKHIIKKLRKNNNDPIVAKLQNDIQLIKNKIFSRPHTPSSSGETPSNRPILSRPFAPDLPKSSQPLKARSTASSQGLSTSKAVKDFKCSPTVITDKYVICDIDGDLVRIKAGIVNKVNIDGKILYVTFSPKQGRLYIKLNPRTKVAKPYYLES